LRGRPRGSQEPKFAKSRVYYLLYTRYTIYRWDGVQACDKWIVPAAVIEAIIRLPIYTDGILCNRVSGCGFVARSIKTIRNHWHAKHRWISQNVRRNRQQAYTQAQREIIQATIIVSYQRAFTHGAGSHYIYVQRAGIGSTVDIEAEETPQPQVVNQLVAQQQAQRSVIEASERDESKSVATSHAVGCVPRRFRPRSAR
jgi:hypothetical protein